MNKTYSKLLCRTVFLSTILMAGSASAGDNIGPMPVRLGQADTFAILSQSGIPDVYRSALAGAQPCTVNDATFLTAAVGDMGYADDAAAGTLNQANATQLTLEGDAQAQNISWQVAGATTLATYAF